jgi:hypothetical protein
MTDLKLVAVIELEQVTAVGLKHAAEFGYDNIQESLEFYCCRKIARETVNDRLPRFMHPDLPLKRKLLRGFKLHFHQKRPCGQSRKTNLKNQGAIVKLTHRISIVCNFEPRFTPVFSPEFLPGVSLE